MAEWKPKYPASLNCTPPGWHPWTGNLFLIPANFDYWAADGLVPLLYAIGLDTPNKITYFNCATRAVLVYLLYAMHMYWTVTALLIFTQVLDCADGQCARRYKLGSEWGAWLDHTTDSIFGAVYAVVVLYMVGETIGYASPRWVFLFVFFCTLGAIGRAIIEAKEVNKHYKDFGILEKLGMYQELYMSAIYVGLMGIYIVTGAFPAVE